MLDTCRRSGRLAHSGFGYPHLVKKKKGRVKKKKDEVNTVCLSVTFIDVHLHCCHLFGCESVFFLTSMLCKPYSR